MQWMRKLVIDGESHTFLSWNVLLCMYHREQIHLGLKRLGVARMSVESQNGNEDEVYPPPPRHKGGEQ